MKIGLSGILLIIFIVLKLIGVISWAWVWVLSPLWVSILIFLSITCLLCLILGFGQAVAIIKMSKTKKDF